MRPGPDRVFREAFPLFWTALSRRPGGTLVEGRLRRAGGRRAGRAPHEILDQGGLRWRRTFRLAEGIDPGGGEKSPLAERRGKSGGGLGRLGQEGEGTQAADPIRDVYFKLHIVLRVEWAHGASRGISYKTLIFISNGNMTLFNIYIERLDGSL